MKAKRIIFETREKVGVFLFELRMWGVRESQYSVYCDYSVATRNPNVIDVATETFRTTDFRIVDWHGSTQDAGAGRGDNDLSLHSPAS